MGKHLAISAASVAVAFAMGVPALHAQQMDEIVVTATQRAQSLNKVPISIAAYTQQKLDKQAIVNFEDVADMTPGVSFGHAGGERTSINIRGIYSGPGTATTGIYINNTPVTIRPDCCVSTNPYPVIFNLKRIEVLRGPQGTLYGAGSMGGTIRFITPEPKLHGSQLYARALTAFTDSGSPTQGIGVAGGSSVIEGKLGFRASMYYRHDGGYVDHINRFDQRTLNPDANWQNSRVARAALKWAPTDRLTITPSVMYQGVKTGDSSRYWEAFSNPDEGQFNNASPVVSPTKDHFTLSALNVKWENDSLALMSNTSYFVRDDYYTGGDTIITTAIFAGVTGPYIPPELANVAMPSDRYSGQEIVTQEFRLQNTDPDARFQWTAGVYYQHTDQKYHYYIDAHQLPVVLNYGNTGAPVTVKDVLGVPLYRGKNMLYDDQSMSIDNMALYGTVNIRLTDKITATIGLRASSNKYESAEFEAGPIVSSRDGFWVYSDVSETPLTPKYSISYEPNPNNMFYLTAAKGYRQGFHTGQVASRCAADLAALGVSGDAHDIKSDSLWNYEVGSKNSLLNGRLQINASIYYIDWKDIQSSLSLPCGNTLRVNLGTAVSKGVDLHLVGRVGTNLSLSLALGYTDAHYTETAYGGGGEVLRPAGEPLPIAPWKVVSAIQYTFSVAGHDAFVRVQHRYTSHDSTPLAVELSTTDPTLPRPPSSSKLDMRVGVHFGNLEVDLFGANLTNQHPEFGRSRPLSSLPPSASLYSGRTVRPRTIGLKAIYRL